MALYVLQFQSELVTLLRGLERALSAFLVTHGIVFFRKCYKCEL